MISNPVPSGIAMAQRCVYIEAERRSTLRLPVESSTFLQDPKIKFAKPSEPLANVQVVGTRGDVQVRLLCLELSYRCCCFGPNLEAACLKTS